MTDIAVVTVDLIDEDVCYKHVDGHVTTIVYDVTYYIDGCEHDVHTYKSKEKAHMAALKFEQGEWNVDECGGVEIRY